MEGKKMLFGRDKNNKMNSKNDIFGDWRVWQMKTFYLG